MIRKLSWMLLLLGAYFWVTTSEDKGDITKKAVFLCHYAKKKWKEMHIEVHVHTPACLKKTAKH